MISTSTSKRHGVYSRASLRKILSDAICQGGLGVMSAPAVLKTNSAPVCVSVCGGENSTRVSSVLFAQHIFWVVRTMWVLSSIPRWSGMGITT